MTATLPNTWTDKGMQNEAFHGAIIFVKDSDYESGFSVYDIYQTATLNLLLELTAEDGFWYVGAKVLRVS